jgi:hypothetical protein
MTRGLHISGKQLLFWSGHLFQGRYKAVLVDADSFLLELVAYIHLNPVRAGMAENPENHSWSSHRAYLGKEIVPWLATDQVLSLIGNHLDKARKLYAHFVGERMGDGHRDEFHRGGGIDSRLLGEERFVDEVMDRARMRRELKPAVVEVLETVKTICAIDDEQLRSRHRGRSITEARTLAAWAVSEFSDDTISEVGRIFGRDVSTLSACIRRLRLKASHDSRIADKMDQIKQALIY